MQLANLAGQGVKDSLSSPGLTTFAQELLQGLGAWRGFGHNERKFFPERPAVLAVGNQFGRLQAGGRQLLRVLPFLPGDGPHFSTPQQGVQPILFVRVPVAFEEKHESAAVVRGRLDAKNIAPPPVILHQVALESLDSIHGGQAQLAQQGMMFGDDNHRRIKSRISPALTVQSHASKVGRVIQREHDGIRWELQPDFAPLLDEVLESPGETVKESAAKRVSRHRVAGKTFYVKRYRHHAVALRPLKFFFKPTQAHREWRLAQQLEGRQIPIVRHVALGERRTWAGTLESILITEGFDGAPLSLTAKIDWRAVLAFVSRMHERGVLQEDLHPANLLARTEPFELRLVDLDGARIFARLTAKQRQENLVFLAAFLPVPISRELGAESRELRKRMLARRSWRCLRNNRDFALEQHGTLKWQVRLPLATEAARRVLNAPDDFLKTRATILKPGRTSTVGKADGLVLKRFNFRKLENLVKDLFRRSRARRAFLKAYHLELAGIPTARCIAVSSRRACGVLLRSYLLMEEITGAVDLGAHLRANGAPSLALVVQAGRLIARLHDQGFSHRDLKESNLLVGADGRIYLLDLDSLYFVEHVSEWRGATDLARLARGVEKYPALKAQHRVVFLLAYCRARGLKRVPRRR